jgi:hypothetical protein
MVLDMAEIHNETDEPELDAWAPLAAANTKLLNKAFGTPFSKAAATAKLSAPPAEQNDRSREKCGGSDDDERDAVQHREYVDRRLKDLAAFERIAAGRAVKRRI